VPYILSKSQNRPFDETFQDLPRVGLASRPIPSRKLVSQSKSHDLLALREFVRPLHMPLFDFAFRYGSRTPAPIS